MSEAIEVPKLGLYDRRESDCLPLREGFLEILNIAHHTEIEGLEQSAYVVYRKFDSEGKPTSIRALPLAEFARYFSMILRPFGELGAKTPPVPPMNWDTVYEPQIGFRHHYKHRDQKGPSDYAYEVLGCAWDAQGKNMNGKPDFVVYRPLYEMAGVFRAGKHWDLRPREMFLEEIESKELEGGNIYTGPRFAPVTDAGTIALLREQAQMMYRK